MEFELRLSYQKMSFFFTGNVLLPFFVYVFSLFVFLLLRFYD